MTAQVQAEELQRRTDQELHQNPDLIDRLQRVEVPENTVVPTRAPSPNHDDGAEDVEQVTDEVQEQTNIPDADPSVQVTFTEVLAQSRLYYRVRNDDRDTRSHVSATRSHGWSALSGLSSSQVSRIAVIYLPLSASEIVGFRRLGLTNQVPTVTASPGLRGALRRLDKELNMLRQEQIPGIALGPRGDDMVSLLFFGS